MLCLLSALAITVTLVTAPAATAERRATDTRPVVKLGLTVRMDPWGLVSISGTMRAKDADVPYNGQKIIIEYSAGGRPPWRAHTQTRVRDNRFSTQFRVGYSGHWRARFAGGKLGRPAVSPVSKVPRWGTQLSAIKASPTRVRKNRPVAASGTLTRYYNLRQPKPSAFPGQNVRIIFRPAGQKSWYHLAWAKTDRRGRYNKKVPAYSDGYYASIFYGSPDTWAVGSPNAAYVDTYMTALSHGLGPIVIPPPSPASDGTPSNATSALTAPAKRPRQPEERPARYGHA